MTVFAPLMQLERELEEITERLHTDHGKELIEKSVSLHEAFAAQGGLTYQSRAKSTILGLGLTDEELKLPVHKLSGGQRSKISLARLLLSEAELLLLDEPTNHLDIKAVEWLEEYLQSCRSAAVIISHDRYFLDRVTKRTLELQGGKFYKSNLSYSDHMKKRETDREIEEKHYEVKKREIERVESAITKLKQFNREKSIRRAESKEKHLDKLKEDLTEPETEHKGMRFQLRPRRTSGNDVLEATGLTMRFDSRTLYQNVDVKVFRGERVFLLGANGCGKTTLFKQILSSRGDVRFGSQVDTGYYDQTLSGLHEEKTVIDEVWDVQRLKTQTEIRNLLAVFLYKNDEVYKPVSALSGGERARVELLKLMMKGYNFLLLDEPTNHLDTYSREALEEALLSYEGTMLIISHDRYFINKLADRIYYLDENGMNEYVGNYDEFIRKRVASEPPRQEKKQSEQALSYKEKKEKEARIRKAKSAVLRTEQQLSLVEEEKGALSVIMEGTNDYNKIIELSKRLEELEKEELSLLEQWEAFHTELGEEA